MSTNAKSVVTSLTHSNLLERMAPISNVRNAANSGRRSFSLLLPPAGVILITPAMAVAAQVRDAARVVFPEVFNDELVTRFTAKTVLTGGA